MKRKKLIVPLVVVGTVTAVGVAFAAIGGFVQVPDAITGLATGGGSSSCQTTSITFTVPEPTFDATVNQYTVSTIDYSGISPACVTLGTADLIVTITNGGSTVYATATASNMNASFGTLNLSSDIEFEDATSASYNFLVRNA
jgi:hypothetical protein